MTRRYLCAADLDRSRGFGEFLDRFEYFGGVAVHLDLVPNPGDAAVGLDQKRAAHNAQKRLPEKTFHAARVIGLDGVELRVAQQRKIQILFSVKFRLRLDRIAAAAQNHGADFVELRLQVAKFLASIVQPEVIALGKK